MRAPDPGVSRRPARPEPARNHRHMPTLAAHPVLLALAQPQPRIQTQDRAEKENQLETKCGFSRGWDQRRR